MYYLQTALTGVPEGCVYALAGAGLVLTYNATGVFNFAHFAIALLGSYVLWQLNGVWGVPLVFAVVLVVGVMAPMLGLTMERTVFRPLQQRQAGTSEKLVATLGVVVLVLGFVYWVWGPAVQGTTEEPVPYLVQPEPFSIGSLQFNWEQVARVAITIGVGVALYVLLRRTFVGTRFRAVVDRRELAQLSAIDVGRVSGLAWAIGCALAALTGILFAPPAIEPFRILFLGIETFSVAVIARLRSLPIALVSGILGLGVGKSLLGAFQPFGDSGFWADTYAQVVTNLSIVLLFVALLVYRRLDEVGEGGTTGQGLVAASLGRHRRGLRPGLAALVAATAVVAVVLPGFLDSFDLRYATQTLALIVIFTSIVCITGFSGHITLGQASIAGLGAYFTARAVNAWDLPVVLAMLLGAGVAAVAGLCAGYPALRRKGVFLGLTTLGLGLVIDRFVFNSELFTGGPGGLTVRPPALFGFTFDTPMRFYYFELVIVGLVLFLARNLRSGRLGRILGAMRDSETAARSVGIDLRRYKLLIFGISSFIAGIGGALLTQANGAWDRNVFIPINSLFWFVAVVVAGVSSLGGAVLAGTAYVMVPRWLGVEQQVVAGVFGLIALFLGRLPGGIVGNLTRLPRVVAQRGSAEMARLRAERTVSEDEAAGAAGPALAPTAFARRVLAEPGTSREPVG